MLSHTIKVNVKANDVVKISVRFFFASFTFLDYLTKRGCKGNDHPCPDLFSIELNKRNFQLQDFKFNHP